MVFRRQVAIEHGKSDRYGRLVSTVFVDSVDVNHRLQAMGLAWHYKAYAGKQRAEDRLSYSQAESAARADGIGLWKDPHPTPPWAFRQRH
jgi:endonuclease YncB( thermonuclease family)